MGRDRLVEKFAEKRGVEVKAVDVQFRRQGSDTEVIVGAPVNTRTTVRGYDLQDAIGGPGTSFVLRSFEDAIGRPIANRGNGWLAAFDDPQTSPPGVTINATYFITATPQRRLGYTGV